MRLFLKNKYLILSIFFAILSVLIIAFKVYYPIEKSNFDLSVDNIINVNSNSTIEGFFKSSVRELERTDLFFVNYNKRLSQGTINITLYDGEDAIYSNNYELKELNDLSYVKMDFYVQKESYNKNYRFVITTRDLKKGESFGFIGKHIDDSDDENNYMSNEFYVRYKGEDKTYMYCVLLFIISCIMVALHFISSNKKYNNYKYRLVLLFLASHIAVFNSFFLLNCIYRNISISKMILIASAIIDYLIFVYLIKCIIYYINTKKIEYVFLSLAIPIGLFFWLVEVPGSAPDEWFHFVSIHKLSLMNFTNIATFPKGGLLEYDSYHAAYNSIINDYNNYEYMTMSFINYPGLLYIFNIFGYLLGRLLHIPLLLKMYLASYFNYILYIVVGYFIIKKTPIFKLLFLLIMLTPIFLQQSTSISIDCVGNLSSLLFIAIVLDQKYGDIELSIKRFIVICILCLLIFIYKFAYFPLIFILFIIRKDIFAFIKDHKKIAIVSIFILFILQSCELYYHKVYMPINFDNSRITYSQLSPGVMDNKMKYTLSSPYKPLAVVYNTFKIDFNDYITDFAGASLKYDEVILPSREPIIFYIGMIIAIIFSAYSNKLSKSDKIVISFIWLLNMAVIFGGIYLDGWIRNLFVQGVQGRYFIPICILPFLLVDISKLKNKVSIYSQLLTIISIIIIINFIALKYLFMSY